MELINHFLQLDESEDYKLNSQYAEEYEPKKLNKDSAFF